MKSRILLLMLSIVLVSGCTNITKTRQDRMEEYMMMPNIGVDINGQFFGINENMTIAESRRYYLMYKTYPGSLYWVNDMLDYVCDGK